MRIYIIGPVAAGKSTLANRLGVMTSAPVYHLDELVHIRDNNTLLGNRKRPQYELERMFLDILNEPDWIMEDTGRDYFSYGIIEADTVVLLEPSILKRYYRIIIRFIKQRLKLEPCNYTPNLRMLKAMFRWTKEYRANEVRNKMAARNTDVRVIRSQKEQNRWLKSVTH